MLTEYTVPDRNDLNGMVYLIAIMFFYITAIIGV
jgi:hypothetical protein